MYRTDAHRPTLPRALAAVCLLGMALAVCGCADPERAEPDLGPPRAADMPAPPAGAGVHARAVRGLASADFDTRTRAARELVAAGDASVPALGRAGDLLVPVAGGMQVSATRSVLQAILTRSAPAALEQHLGSPWANVRRVAAEELGRRDRWSAIPRLIERLEDPDLGVRAASAASLRRLTNNFMGYRAEASLGRRRAGADRWRGWWSQEGRERTQERSRSTAHADRRP